MLDLNKILMYDFHYNYIKKKYGHKAKVCFTDTQKLIFEIETNDVYKDFDKDKDKFNFRKYPENSKIYDDAKAIPKKQQETESVLIVQFVVLKSKTYSHV